MGMFSQEYMDSLCSVDEVKRTPYPMVRYDCDLLNEETIQMAWDSHWNQLLESMDRFLEFHEFFEDGMISNRNRIRYEWLVDYVYNLKRVHDSTIVIYERKIEELELELEKAQI